MFMIIIFVGGFVLIAIAVGDDTSREEQRPTDARRMPWALDGARERKPAAIPIELLYETDPAFRRWYHEGQEGTPVDTDGGDE